MLSDGSPLTPRRYPYGRSRRSSMSSSLHVTSPAVSPLSSPKPTPRGTPEESPLNTPPGSPGMNQPYWKSRLNTIKSSFLGSPRFHRRKMQTPSASDEVSLTPDSSPELTKRSWFGSLMTNERDETHVILVKDRPLSSVKADLIHAFLSISDLCHSVISPMSFRVEYKRAGGPTMFQRNVRFHVDIALVSAGTHDGPLSAVDRRSSTDKPAVYCISFTLISGPIRRFKRICEHIQAQILGRRPNHSPRISRRPTTELSESSSCGSESMSPTPSRHQVANDDMAVSSMNASSAAAVAISRCKSDQDATADIFEREAKMVTTSHRRAAEDVRPLLNGRRMSYDLKNSSKDKL
ncbi:Serine/threonine-protein kinase BRSK2, partial [Stegodyphus mimosarum]